MKKLLVASIVIASSLSVGGVSTTVHAADAGTVTFSYNNFAHHYEVTPATITAKVGDTITVSNAEAFSIDVGSPLGSERLVDTNGTAEACSPIQNNGDCMVSGGTSVAFTITALGTVSIMVGSDVEGTFEIVAPNSRAPRQPKRTVTLDPAGGVCSGHSEPWTEEFRGSLDLPTKDDCSKVGYEFLGWVWVRGLEACHWDIQEDCPSTSKVFLSGGLMAIWRELSPPEPPVGASVLVNFLCTICSQVAIWWEPSPSSGVTYEIVVSTGDPKTTSSTTNVTQPALASAPFIFELGPNIRYTIELFAVRAGVRSSAAFFNPVASGSTSSSEDLVSSIPPTRTPYASFMLRDAPENRTITIDCGRTTVSGKPGVYCNGQTTGFATGDVMIPMVKFPGQTEYTAGAARPAVGTAGGFSWQRKTGKKVYVYFVSQDGKTTSSRYIIPAK